jgi:predicted O-methyltransferase YrrM
VSPTGGVGALARRVRGVRARARRLWELSAPPATPVAPTPAVSPTPSPEPAAPPDPPLLCWPLDHFYSPVPDNRALAREPARSRVWPPVPRPTPGIDWRGEEQVALLRDHLGSQEPIDLPAQPTGDPRDYHTANEMFSRLDAWMLQGMLRHFRPRRMVEVGCGWSSLLTARVNREYLGGELHFTCIEPYPPDFLTSGIDGISELVVAPVQEAPLDKFLSLADRDVLFIDSSHTVKTGGDVPYLFEEVLPRLAPGVVIHVHDIALPLDYPEEWVLAGRAWNEQYLVRAFLAFNSAFRILLGVSWLNANRPDVLGEVLTGYPQAYGDSGASLWIQRTA